MKVLAYPSDRTGSGRCRVTLPVEAAKAAGCDIELGSTGGPNEGIPIERRTLDGRNYVRPQPIDADVLFLQRVADETTVAILPQIMKAGIAVVIDIDDDLSCLPATHPAHRVLHPATSPTLNWRLLEHVCRIADLVIASTPALAERYGRHGRVRVLENRIPERLATLPHAGDGNTVGWTGWTVTHPGDLAVPGSGIAQAVRSGARFLHVGPPLGVREQLALDEEPEATGPLEDIDDYYAALGRLDVGITPLANTRFTRAKSWLKPLELAGAGAVPVMSPRAEYQRLHDQGVGVIAGDRGREWKREITRLLTDPGLRGELAARGREVVAERHTYEGNGHLWVEAFEQALQNRRGSKLAA